MLLRSFGVWDQCFRAIETSGKEKRKGAKESKGKAVSAESDSNRLRSKECGNISL